MPRIPARNSEGSCVAVGTLWPATRSESGPVSGQGTGRPIGPCPLADSLEGPTERETGLISMFLPRFSLWQIMVATGVIGALVGLLLRDANAFMHVAAPVAFVPALAALACTLVRKFLRLPIRLRLAIETTAVIILLTTSTLIWRPRFYKDEEQRCKDLARLASEAITESPEVRVALVRESAWLSRGASALRWRGLWLGLTMGPSTGDETKMSEADFVYQLGVLESIEKHEKEVKRYISPSPSSP
jgi:hypothetical protein